MNFRIVWFSIFYVFLVVISIYRFGVTNAMFVPLIGGVVIYSVIQGGKR